MNKILKAGLVAGGAVAAASLLRRTMNSEPRYAPWEKPPYETFRHKVLIVGGGFAGYTVAQDLCEKTRGRDDVGVMLISKENFFTFWPMVPEVVGKDVDVENIAQPLRRPLIKSGASFRRAGLEGVDFERKVVTAGGREFEYDHLVIALGAQPNFFGIPGVEEHALSMRGVADAEKIRNRVIERFEDATLSPGRTEDSKLNFVVIGGGATGVETASQLHSLINHALAPDYPSIDPNRVRVYLLEAADDILLELDPALRRIARARLADRHIEVMTNTAAKEVTVDRVILNNGEEIESENVIWTAGGRPNSTLKNLDLPLTHRDGVIVDEYLRVEDREGVWSLGDCAAIPGENGQLVPPTAQAATQEGTVLARNILASIDGSDKLEKFRYRPLGQLVELGADFAVNDIMGVKFSGFLAALFWRATYVYKLKSPQNRVRIVLDWLLHAFYRPATTQIRGLE